MGQMCDLTQEPLKAQQRLISRCYNGSAQSVSCCTQVTYLVVVAMCMGSGFGGQVCGSVSARGLSSALHGAVCAGECGYQEECSWVWQGDVCSQGHGKR